MYSYLFIHIHICRYLTGGESTRRRASMSRRGNKTQGGGGSTKRSNSLNTTNNNANNNSTINNSNSNKNNNATNINNECITDNESELSRFSQIYLFITIKSYELINHPIFIYLQVVVIFLTLINVGLETDMSNAQHAYIVTNIEIIFLSFFTIEIGVRILSFGLRPFAYFRDRWNIFDVLIIAG